MTPIHLNHPTSTIPILEYKDDHSLQLLSSTQTINRPTPPSTSSFLNLHARDQQHAHTIGPIQALAKDEKFIFHGEGENPHGTTPSLWSEQSVKDGNYERSQNSSYDLTTRAEEVIKPSSSKRYSSSWRSASHPKMGSSKHPVEFKPRVRIVHNRFQDRERGNHSNGGRECSDCHTTTTPLWRSGPQGPKTLCNACGIRQRKARRAKEAAAAAAAARSNNNATVLRTNERGSIDESHLLPYKKRGKLLNIGSPAATATTTTSFYETKKKAAASLDDDSSSSSASCLSKDSDSQQRSFPPDEEEAAVLLMALSCGLA